MHPAHIGLAASRGDLDTIRAYFEDEGARDVDYFCEGTEGIGMTPLMLCAGGESPASLEDPDLDEDELTLRHVELARYLLSRGASIDKEKGGTGSTALILSCYTNRGTVAEMVSLLLSAGANPNARSSHGRTTLSAHVTFCANPSVECVTALLRAGASLDRVYKEYPFEYHFPADINSRDPESFWSTMRTLTVGVRSNGSFERYVREPHREVLALRGLAMRGHLAPRGTRRTRRNQQWEAAVAFLARHGDNGVVWNVLSFWRATK